MDENGHSTAWIFKYHDIDNNLVRLVITNNEKVEISAQTEQILASAAVLASEWIDSDQAVKSAAKYIDKPTQSQHTLVIITATLSRVVYPHSDNCWHLEYRYPGNETFASITLNAVTGEIQ